MSKNNDRFFEPNEEERRRKNKKVAIIIIIIAIVVIGCVVALVLVNNTNSNQVSTGTNDKENAKGLSFEDNQKGKNKFIKSVVFPGWERFIIDANTPNVTVDFYNPEENEDNFYMTYELYLKDTGEVLYKSGLLKPGVHVRDITLTRGLAPGTYKAVVHMQPYTADDDMIAKNDATVHVELVVS